MASVSMNVVHQMTDGQRITCTACQVEVVGSEQRRIHYRTDLHLVNLKRKVGGLGPLNDAEFEQRLAVLEQNKRLEAESDKSNRSSRSNRQKTVCEACRKTFSSQQSFMNHEKSRRHLDAMNRQHPDAMSDLSSSSHTAEVDTASTNDGYVPSATDDGDGGDWKWADDDDGDVEKELRRRLDAWDENGSEKRSAFDDHELSSGEDALEYMARKFGLFVPYLEHLIDAAGLVKYLSQKVCVGYACIACDKGFASGEDARKHMRDVGHRRMTSDDETFFEEYEEFYNWSLKSVTDRQKQKDDQWVEVTGDEESKLLQQASKSTTNDKTSTAVVLVSEGDEAGDDGRPRGRLDTGDGNEGDDAKVGEEAYAVAIGSKIIGHRSLQRYYKQAGSGNVDLRDAVVASRMASEMRVAAWKADRKRMTKSNLNAQSFASRRRQYFELSVGTANYYVRKSKLHQNLVVLNSGYRA